MIVYITTHLPQYTCISTNLLYGRGGVINRKGRGIILISDQIIDKMLDSSETTCVSTMKRCYLCLIYLFMSQSSDDYIFLQ